MVWKGTAQDFIDHMRRIHKVPLSVKAANLARFFLPWTVTREQWADMMMPSISGVVIDTLLFSCIGSPLCHRYWIISRTGSHAAFRGTYLRCLNVLGGKEQAMAAALNLQRDAGIMLSNLQILSQFATALHRMSFQMMAFGIGQSLFPSAEIDDLSPAGSIVYVGHGPVAPSDGSG